MVKSWGHKRSLSFSLAYYYNNQDLFFYRWIMMTAHSVWSDLDLQCKSYITCADRFVWVNSLQPLLHNADLYSLPNDKFNFAQMIIFVSGCKENIAGKGEKCWLPAFSHFPTMFSKGFFPKVVKSRDCVV